jgi:hypothetical protein
VVDGIQRLILGSDWLETHDAAWLFSECTCYIYGLKLTLLRGTEADQRPIEYRQWKQQCLLHGRHRGRRSLHVQEVVRSQMAEKCSPPLEANATAMRVFTTETVATEVSKRSGENSRWFGGKWNWRRNRPGTNATICYSRDRRTERVVRCYEYNGLRPYRLFPCQAPATGIVHGERGRNHGDPRVTNVDLGKGPIEVRNNA